MLYMAEYSDIGSTSRGSIPIPLEPPLREQAIPIGSMSAQSEALASDTCIIKLVSDTDCAIAIGINPDATGSVRVLPSGKEQILTVLPGSKMKIAVVASGSGSMSDSLGAFLKVVASPADAQKTLASLQKQAGDIDASTQALRAASEGHKQAKADADAAVAKAAAAQSAASQAASEVQRARDQLAAEQAAYDVKAKDDAATLAARDKAMSDREAAVISAGHDLANRESNIANAAKTLDARERDLKTREAAATALKTDFEDRVARLKALAG